MYYSWTVEETHTKFLFKECRLINGSSAHKNSGYVLYVNILYGSVNYVYHLFYLVLTINSKNFAKY
jgi:hypothetical protein